MVEAWRALATVDEHNHDFRSLIGDLRRVAELDPKDVETKVRLAKLYLLAGATDEALKTTNAAIELDPQNANNLALKAAILFRLKDTDGAIQTAQKALAIDPSNTDANVVLAVQKFSQGDSDGALKVLENVTGAHNDDLSVLLLKINIYERMGNLAQAESSLRKLIELHPKEPPFRAQLIRFYIAHKRPADAV